MTIPESHYQWIYSVLAVAGFALLFVFPASTVIANRQDRRKYHAIQLFTLVGAIFGAKVSMLMADLGWPAVSVGWREVVFSGRSITGALLGGFFVAELAKPLFGYTLPPNDRFAAKLPFSIALGRVGCLLAGCCRGVPHAGRLTVTYEDGIARWPAPAFEMAFQLVAGAVLVAFVRRGWLPGRLFAVYMMGYGVFRFATEFLRETPKPLGALSVYQVFSVVMVVAGVVSFVWRSRITDVRQSTTVRA